MDSDDSPEGPPTWWSVIVLYGHNVIDTKTSFGSPPLIELLQGIEIFSRPPFPKCCIKAQQSWHRLNIEMGAVETWSGSASSGLPVRK